jgi:hypothetical protein
MRSTRSAGSRVRAHKPASLAVFGTAQKAREHLMSKGSAPSLIQDAGGKQFFEVRDPEGNAIEICEA